MTDPRSAVAEPTSEDVSPAPEAAGDHDDQANTEGLRMSDLGIPRAEGHDMKKVRKRAGKTRVTFELPAEAGTTPGWVCGDFNDWTSETHPLTQRKDGSLSVTVTLTTGRCRYRYLLDGGRWENDWHADAYQPNPYGSDDSIVEV
jgi:1,4-alpha-glucan branching enzyme